MIPRIAKTADRHPYEPGTPLRYWNVVGPHEAIITDYRGVAQILTADDAAGLTDLGNQKTAEVGEEVIIMLDANGNKTSHYERIHHIDPMEDEPQRWFPEGVDPNTLPHAGQS